MVDKIEANPSASSALAAQAASLRADAPARPEKKAEAAPDKNAVETPQIKISEVANEAANDKLESIQSLDAMANELREAINALNSALAKTPTKAIITRDDELNRFIVRIADKSSGEVVREIPSEAILKFARNLQELKGLIFDKSL